MPYAPATQTDIDGMLETLRLGHVDDLFADIPSSLRFDRTLDIPVGISEQELTAEAVKRASENVDMQREVSFLGYGAYDHFVPSVCGAITSRSEFATAYTPYQPEISQGTLQAIFEFQTGISELTGLPVSNASLYDGATAVAEAMYVSEQMTRRTHAVVLKTVHPQLRAVIDTYARAYGMTITEVDWDVASGTTPNEAVAEAITQDTACVIVQQPNVFGCFEDAPAMCALAREHDAVPVVSCDALSLGVVEAPGSYGAAIVVGDGQALGNATSFGGPAFGFMAAEDRFVRRMPGRIVGQTLDAAGERSYVLTYQTREQHIRREKATSNICTNQALNALSGIVYLSWLGANGLREIGLTILERRQALVAALAEVPGVTIHGAGNSAGFKELVITTDRDAAMVIRECKSHGVHPGFAIGTQYPELGKRALLVAVTECRTANDIGLLAGALREVLA